MSKMRKRLWWLRTTQVSTLLLLSYLLLLVSGVSAQTGTIGSANDGTTPSALAPGSPTGSYALSDFEVINPYNGHLSLAFPLLKVGGRGVAGYSMTLPIDQTWTARQFTVANQCMNGNCPSPTTYYNATLNWWTGLRPGFTPGVVQGRRVGGFDTQGCNQTAELFGIGHRYLPATVCGGNNINIVGTRNTLTRLTFIGPDNSEVELHDQATGGQPVSGACNSQTPGFNRGRTFVSADGSGVTFVSDADISDIDCSGAYPAGLTANSNVFSVSGYLHFNSGTLYRIDGGKVSWIRDPDGNQTTFGDNSVSDSLGRQITFSSASDYSQINVAGFGGAPRSLRIHYGSLSTNLRSDQTLQTYHQLFPEIYDETNSPGPSLFDVGGLVSALELPDGRSYRFYYNSYAEVARVELPTGGAIEYDYAAGVDLPPRYSGVLGSPNSNKEIYRRVTERRLYPNGGSGTGYARRTTFSRNSSDSDSYYTSLSQGSVTVDERDAGTLLARTKHYYYGSPVKSLFIGWDSPAVYGSWQEGKEYQAEAFDSDGATVLRRITNDWQQRTPVSWWSNWCGQQGSFCASYSEPPNDPRIIRTTTTLVDSNLVMKHEFAYDQFNNRTDEWDFDFGAGTPPTYARRHSHTDYLTINPVNGVDYTSIDIHRRSLPFRQWVKAVDPSTGQEPSTFAASSEMSYDEPAYPLIPYGPVTGWNDPGTIPRGKPTTIRRWLDSSNSWIETHAQFDQCGSVRNIWDAKGNQSQIEYSTTYAYAYPTLTRTAVPDPSGQHGSTAAFVTTNVFDFSTGLVTSSTDANNVVTTLEYNDALNRPTRTVRAYGTSVQSQSSIAYDDVNRIITTTSDQNNYDDNLLKSQIAYDGLGRTIESRQYEGGTNYIAVQEQYDAMGRAFKTSNPFRPGETILWTTTGYDSLSRLISTTTPDNAVVKTAYSGNRVLVADQNESDQLRRKRISETDALGRLKHVWEVGSADGATEGISFPGWPDVTAGYLTSYEYNTLDHLTTVTQGSQTHSFVYDSLNRLTSALNPESGTVGYQYDENGNLKVKTDARGVSAHFSYDALNRMTRRWYNSSTSLTEQTNNSPALPGSVATSDEVANFYDSQGLPPGGPTYSAGYANGRLAAVTYGTGSSAGDYYGYDAAGRAVLKIQRTAGTDYQVSATYNLAGAFKSQTYPSGNIVNYGYDGAGRTNSMTGRLGDGRNRTYATGISYSSLGGIAQEQFGTQTSLYHKLHYNLRGQLFDIRVSSYSLAADEWNWNRGALVSYYSSNFSWGGNSTGSGLDNNGNVTRQQHWVPTSDPSNYSYTQDDFNYDSLDRLSSTNEIHGGPTSQSGQDYVQSYDYDRWGNRTINPASSSVINHTQFDKNDAQNSNRLYAPGDMSLAMSQRKMQYDPAGNLTLDSYTGDGRTRSYDADNRLSLLAFPPPQPVCYPDGEGGQTCYPVDDSGKNPPIQYVYDGDGHRVRRFINNQETRQVYGLAGELLAEYAASTSPTTLQKEYGYRNGQLLITAAPGYVSSGSTGPGSSPATSWSSADLLARINKVNLPAWVGGLLASRESAEAISDTSTPLYGPRFPYASLNTSVLPVMPQSGSARIAFASNRDGTAQLYSMNTDGSGALRLTNDAANDESPRWSPNGSRIVFQSDRDNVFSGMADIYVMNGDGSGQTRLTSDANDDSAPVWSPNGSKIAFQSGRNGVSYQVYVMNADGSAQANISNNAANDKQPAWSPDGTKIAFASDRDQAGFSSIYVMNADGSGQTRLTVSGSGFRDEQPAWSPDGTKLAFTSTRDSTVVTWTENDDDGRTVTKTAVYTNKEVYVMNANGSNQVRLTNTLENDDSPTWSNDGTKIAFRSDRQRDCCDPTNQVWVMNADGSNAVDLSNNGFGDYSPSWSNIMAPPPPPNGAQFISQSVAQTMVAGQSYSVSVTMKNTGSNTWTTASHHNLGSQNAQDNTTWGMGRVGLPFSVASGSQATFTSTLTAPATSGTYNFQWRMVQDGVEWFGDLTPNVVVTVTAQSGGNPNPEPDPSTPVADVRWIVADHLGTPRMIFDQSGSIANVSLHDYLPFGEELAGQVGGRTAQQGYAGDNTRQKFTQKERDSETGLDYFGARHYGSLLGRFTSVDPLTGSALIARPQTWNRYAYVLNNPLRLVDPLGLSALDPEDQQPKSKPARKDGDDFSGPSCPGICPNPAAIAVVRVPFGPAAPQPIQTNETPIVTTLSPSMGPSTGPRPQTTGSESRSGLFGVNLGGFAAVGYGGVAAVDTSVNAGASFSGNGGIGAAGSFGAVITDEGIGPGFGYPSDEGYGYGLAASAGPGIFYSNARTYEQLQGPFETTIIATPIVTLQFDSAIGDSVRVFQFSGPSGLGIFHFQTTTPHWATVDVPVTVPLNKY
jgi:RHS repeat-associated protein